MALPREHDELPREVGVRDLRDNISRYLDLIAEGVEVVITNHGKPVARLSPIGAPSKLDLLIAAGLATPALDSTRTLPAPLDLDGVVVSDLVIEQRR